MVHSLQNVTRWRLKRLTDFQNLNLIFSMGQPWMVWLPRKNWMRIHFFINLIPACSVYRSVFQSDLETCQAFRAELQYGRNPRCFGERETGGNEHSFLKPIWIKWGPLFSLQDCTLKMWDLEKGTCVGELDWVCRCFKILQACKRAQTKDAEEKIGTSKFSS